MPNVRWTPQAADATHIKAADQTCTYTMQAGNTPHHVAELITPILNEKRGPDAQLTVAQVRESIVTFNSFDTSQAHAKDSAYDGKSVYRLQIGQEIKLPDEYAAALHEANQGLSAADQVDVSGVDTAPTEAPAPAPAPGAAPVDQADPAAAAAHELAHIEEGGADAAPTRERGGPWGNLGERGFGSGLFRRDPEKVEARQTARAERQETRQIARTERQQEREQRITDRTEARAEAKDGRIAAREEAKGERIAAHQAREFERAEARGDRIIAREDARERRAIAQDARVTAREEAKDERVAHRETAKRERQTARETRLSDRAEAVATRHREAEAEKTAAQHELATFSAGLDPVADQAVIAYIEQHKGNRPARVLEKAQKLQETLAMRSDRSEKREAVAALRGTIRDVRSGDVEPGAALDAVASLNPEDGAEESLPVASTE